ncbi:MAG: hypothetical protein ACBZ72_01655 [Candidatus Bathyarchaeia archaeon]|jgi:formylmethanofuran dehydrogenase subunit E
MPYQIMDSNSRVAEVRVICDECGRLIGGRLMLLTEIENKRNEKVLCQNCKEAKQI